MHGTNPSKDQSPEIQKSQPICPTQPQQPETLTEKSIHLSTNNAESNDNLVNEQPGTNDRHPSGLDPQGLTCPAQVSCQHDLGAPVQQDFFMPPPAGAGQIHLAGGTQFQLQSGQMQMAPRQILLSPGNMAAVQIQHAGQIQQVGQIQHAGQIQLAGQIQHPGHIHHNGQILHAGQIQHAAQMQHAVQMQHAGQMQIAGQVQHMGQIQHAGQVQQAAQIQHTGPIHHGTHIQIASQLQPIHGHSSSMHMPQGGHANQILMLPGIPGGTQVRYHYLLSSKS